MKINLTFQYFSYTYVQLAPVCERVPKQYLKVDPMVTESHMPDIKYTK